ncbi:MAG: DUF378 domain-containing protein [Armatimonadota bacterium]
MKYIKALAPILVTVGAINWGLVGAAKFDAVGKLLGNMSKSSRTIYGLVGAAGLYFLATIPRQVAEETHPAAM